MKNWKILKVVKLLIEICGGWWAIMSGVISIPIGFCALFVLGGGHDRVVFAILAYVALWVLAVGMALRNYKSMEGMELRLKLFEQEKLKLTNEHKTQQQELENKLAEKSEADKLVIARQFAKEMLGYKLLVLDNRLTEARGISRYDFEKELKKSEWEKTSTIFTEIQSALGKYLTIAEASRFIVARPEPLKEPAQFNPYFTEKALDWQWHVNSIVAKLDTLKKIVEQL